MREPCEEQLWNRRTRIIDGTRRSTAGVGQCSGSSSHTETVRARRESGSAGGFNLGGGLSANAEAPAFCAFNVETPQLVRDLWWYAGSDSFGFTE